MSVYCIFFSSFQSNNRHTVDTIVIIACNISSNSTCQCSLIGTAKAQSALP